MVYRKTFCNFWRDPRVMGLPPEGRLMLIHLRTCHHSHMCGWYPIDDATIAKETGLAVEQVSALWPVLETAGLVIYDLTHSEVLVRNIFRDEMNAKTLVHTAKHIAGMFSAKIQTAFLSAYPEIEKLLPNPTQPGGTTSQTSSSSRT